MQVRYVSHPEIAGYAGPASTFRPGDVTVLFERSVDSVPVAALEVYLVCCDRWVPLTEALRAGGHV